MSKSVIKVCVECNKEFFARSTYYFHKKLYHEKKEVLTENKHYKTCDCGKNFQTKSAYYHHHKICNIAKSVNKLPQNFLCQEDNCHFNCSLQTEFLNHLNESHGIESSWLEKAFQNYAEFEEWKDEFEKFTKTAFKCQCTRQNSTAKLKYFECNRSGSYTSRSTGKRAPKLKGSLKIGFKCPANMKVLIDKKSLTVNATVCCLHYKHDCDRDHSQKLRKARTSGATNYSVKTKNSVAQHVNSLSGSPCIKLKTCQETSEQDKAINDNVTCNDLQSEIPSTDIRDLECLIENSVNDNENHVFNPSPSNEDSNLTSLKSSIISKTMALYNSIKTCNSKDVLLRAEVFINNASSILKRNTETRKPLIIKRMKSILTHKTIEKPLILITKQKRHSEETQSPEQSFKNMVNLEVRILNDPIKHADIDDHSYTILS